MNRLVATLSTAFVLWAGGLLQARCEPMIAEVRLNGQAEDVVQLDVHGDDVAMSFEALNRLRLKQPQGAATNTDVVLGSLPGVHYRVDQAAQAIEIIAEPSALSSTRLQAPRPTYQAPTRSDWGGALNYAVFAQGGDQSPVDLSGVVEARAFGPVGVFSQSATARRAQGAPNNGVRRLDTAYTLDDYRHSRSLVVGDFISSSLPWTTAVRAGGIHLSTDFSLRPDLVTQPQPQIRGSAAVASSVDLFIDGVKRMDAKVPSGPFSIEATPMVDGQGRVDMVVTDALGRQTVQSLPFYAASELLAPGRSEYSIDAGALREDYASDTDHYSAGFASVTARRGLTDYLTIEGRAAARRDLQTAGFGVVAKLGQEALFAVAFSHSNAASGLGAAAASPGAADRPPDPGGSGSQYFVSARRQTPLYSLYMTLQQGSGAYRDLDWEPGQSRIQRSVQIGASLRTGAFGAVSATYSRLETDRGGFSVAGVSWSRGIGPISVYATAFSSGDGGGQRFTLGFSTLLGGSRSINAQATATATGLEATASVAQAPPLPTGYGWRLSADTGDGGSQARSLEGSVQRTTQIGQAEVGVSVYGSHAAARFYGSGSVVWLGGAPMMAARLGDGFAVIETGAPNVAVTVENRPLGNTDSHGRLLAPQLPALMASRIALDPRSVSLDDDIKIQTLSVQPGRGGGLRVRMPVVRTHSATAIFVGADGRPLDPGASVSVNDQDSGLVGYDGRAYLTGLENQNIIEITSETGSCRMEVRVEDADATLPEIGPLVCRLVRPPDPFGPPGRVADSGFGDELHR